MGKDCDFAGYEEGGCCCSCAHSERITYLIRDGGAKEEEGYRHGALCGGIQAGIRVLMERHGLCEMFEPRRNA